MFVATVSISDNDSNKSLATSVTFEMFVATVLTAVIFVATV